MHLDLYAGAGLFTAAPVDAGRNCTVVSIGGFPVTHKDARSNFARMVAPAPRTLRTIRIEVIRGEGTPNLVDLKTALEFANPLP